MRSVAGPCRTRGRLADEVGGGVAGERLARRVDVADHRTRRVEPGIGEHDGRRRRVRALRQQAHQLPLRRCRGAEIDRGAVGQAGLQGLEVVDAHHRRGAYGTGGTGWRDGERRCVGSRDGQ